jgi:transposase
MRKDDARKLDHKTLEEMRMRTVKRIQDGESPAIIARVLGAGRSTVYGWLARYRRGGSNGLKAEPMNLTSAEARRQEAALGLQHSDKEKPSAIEVRVCAVDTRDGREADQGQVPYRLERGVGRAASGSTRHYLPEAIASCAGTGRGFGSAMAKEGLSGNQGNGAKTRC